MRRIAIISSYAWIKVANNYGALLQYYALQQYLNRKGCYAFWIRLELYNTSLKIRLQEVLRNCLRHHWYIYILVDVTELL